MQRSSIWFTCFFILYYFCVISPNVFCQVHQQNIIEKPYPLLIPLWEENQVLANLKRYRAEVHSVDSSLYQGSVIFLKYKLPAKWTGTATSFVDKVRIPAEWKNSEKMLYTANSAGDLYINNTFITHLSGKEPIRVNISAFINPSYNSISVMLKEKGNNSLSSTPPEMFIYATDKIELSDLYIYTSSQQKYNNERYLNTSLTFRYGFKNHTPTPFDIEKLDYSFKVYNASLQLAGEIKKTELPSRPNYIRPQQENLGYSAIFTNVNLYTKFSYWSSEQPVLYYLLLRIGNPLIHQSFFYTRKFGVRTVSIKENQLYVNNKQVPLKPIILDLTDEQVNSLSFDSLRGLVKTFKQLYINTIILTDFISKAPLYELCDEYGMYIIQQLKEAVPKNVANYDTSIKTSLAGIVSKVHKLKNNPSLILWDSQKITDAKTRKAIEDTIQKIDSERAKISGWNYGIYTTLHKEPNWSKLSVADFKSIKKAYQAVRFIMNSNQSKLLRLESDQQFDTLHVRLVWQIYQAGTIHKEGEIQSVELLPKSAQDLALPFDVKEYVDDKTVRFHFKAIANKEKSWATGNFEIASEGFQFREVQGTAVLVKTDN